MTGKAIIRLGDKTSHDGVVLEAFENFNIFGKPAAGIGHKGHCPKCKRDFFIVAGAENVSYFGKSVALEGMKTSCGAVLIASQSEATVDVASGANNSSGSSGSSSSATRTAKAASAASPAAVANDTETVSYDEHFHLISETTGRALVGYPYRIALADGTVVEGKTDENGLTAKISAELAAMAELTVFDYDEITEIEEGA